MFVVLSLYDFLSEIRPQPSPLLFEASLLLSFHGIVYSISPTPPPDQRLPHSTGVLHHGGQVTAVGFCGGNRGGTGVAADISAPDVLHCDGFIPTR